METKICYICKKETPLDQYRMSYCVSCKKEYEKQHNWKRRKWNDEHKDKKPGYDKTYLSKPGVKERKQKKDKEWKKLNYEKRKKKNFEYNKEYHKRRKAADPLYKLKDNIRSAIHGSFYDNGSKKSKRTECILGCTFEELKQHLESQFEPWMNWNNRGGKVVKEINTTWDIDHIIPISSAQTEEDVIRLNHYTNFQPLCSYVNRYIKRDKHG